MKTPPTVVSGFALCVLGAGLDGLSALGALQGQDAMTNGSQFLLGVGLFLLAAGVLATGVTMAVPAMRGSMRRSGALMELFGVVMGLVSTYIPSMSPGLADAMLGVGVLMFVNGLLMQSQAPKSTM